MANLHEALLNLRDFEAYLDGFHESKRSAHFEHLVIEAVSLILSLPLYDSDNDNSGERYRAVWLGKEATWDKAPPGADGIIYAHDFYILIEPTLKTGTTQWSQEFASCVAHYDDFIAANGLRLEDCFLLGVMNALHENTYVAFKQKATEKCPFIVLTLSDLTNILDTKLLVCTVSHSDLRLLFKELSLCCAASQHKQAFQGNIAKEIAQWRQKLLKREKLTFVGIKSYEAINRIGKIAALSQIHDELFSDTMVERYFEALGEPMIPTDIELSLEQEKFAYKAYGIPTGENFYCPTPLYDIKGRLLIVLKELENVSAST